MTTVFVAMCVTQALTAVALASHAPGYAVFILVAVSSVAATPYRSAHLAMVPLVAGTAVELVAMNVAAGTLEGLATFAGPALAGVFLLRAEPWFVMAVASIIAALGVVAVSRVRVGVDPSKALRRTPDRPVDALIGGLTELRKNSDVTIVVGCFVAQLLVRGFLTVLLVSVSFDLLGLGSSGVGWLAAVIGVGGIVGGFGAVVLTGRRRLARPFAFALCLWGLPIVVIGVHPTTAIVAVALFTIGVGNALLDVSGLTLIQRLGADRSLGRVFGVLFTVGIAIGGVGALAAPLFVSALGLRRVLVLVGAILPILALVLTPRFRSLDDHSEPVPELLALFCNISLFAPLPPTSIEKIAARCTTSEIPAGRVIITEGDPGDRFYAILRGQVEVRRAGLVAATLGPGDHFGEIALVRDVNRTASVVATTDVTAATLGSTEFLDALASSEDAYGIAWTSTAEMLDGHSRVGG